MHEEHAKKKRRINSHLAENNWYQLKFRLVSVAASFPFLLLSFAVFWHLVDHMSRSQAFSTLQHFYMKFPQIQNFSNKTQILTEKMQNVESQHSGLKIPSAAY